jgi:hypothetical protein
LLNVLAFVQLANKNGDKKIVALDVYHIMMLMEGFCFPFNEKDDLLG